MPNKQDSNVTSLNFAEETSIGTLPATPEWYALDPNSYQDFGGETVLLARKILSKDRQLRKGVVVDINASGGFNVDLTYSNMWRLLQGFFYKDVAEKATTVPMNGTAIPITAIVNADGTFDGASGLAVFKAGHLIKPEGFGDSPNNVLMNCTASSATDVTVSQTLTEDASPASTGLLRAVGFQFDTSTCDVVVSGDLPVLNRASGAQDWTDSGIVAGNIVYLNSDVTAGKFVATNNRGWGRVKTITASAITFDKFSSTMTAEIGTDLDIQIFFGEQLNNDTDGDNIDTRTYNLERQLGSDGNGVQSEYLIGAQPNELTITMSQADKIHMDLSFVAQNHETYDGTTGIKSGNRNTLPADEDAYNTSSDIGRAKVAVMSSTSANPTALYAYMKEFKITVNNNVVPNKAISVTGAFDMTADDFEVSGDIEAYFGDNTAVEAIKANSDVSIDYAIAKDNRGFAMDIPLVALGGGKLNVSAGESIGLPLTSSASKDSTYNYTLAMTRFSYLPTVAG
jgi:hypothetical protein